MHKVTPEILEYVRTQRVGVLAVEMMDGSPHAATVHFSHTEDPLVFFFETDRKYRKSEALFGRDESRASFVIGSNESDMKTLQMDGTVKLLEDNQRAVFDNAYWNKFAEKKEKATRPGVVFFTFVPSWWRFTDWTGSDGKVILNSED